MQLPFLVMPGHTRAGRRRPQGHPLASEVVGRGEEVIVSGCLNSVASVSIFSHGPPAEKSRPMAYPAANAHLSRHLEHGLVDDSLTQLGAQAHGR